MNILKTLVNIKKASKDIINFSKETIGSMNEEDRLSDLLKRIKSLNEQGDQYEIMENQVNSLTDQINTLREVENEFSLELETLEAHSSKESVMKRIELKSKLTVTVEELYPLIAEKEELVVKAKKLKDKYIKEYSTLNKLLSNKANIDLLEKNDKLDYDPRSFTEKFEEAVNNFTFELFEIKDSTSNNIINAGNVHIYGAGDVVEAKFDLEKGTFLVSVSSRIDSIKIGIRTKANQTELIGQGENFGDIKWTNTNDFGNHNIVQFYEELLKCKKQVEKQKQLYTGIEKPKHLYLVS